MDTASFIPRETKETRENEELFKQRIEGYWDVELEHLPSTYSLDYAIKRGSEVVSWMEIKCRTNKFADYPTYMIGLKKWNAMREFQASSHLKAFLGVAFTDGDYWVDCSRVTNFFIKMGGMPIKKRNWLCDREPCVYFDTKFFKQWKT